MPWITPTRDELRAINRDNIQSELRSTPLIPNSGLRVVADGNAGLAFLTMLYIKWLADQLMPDTSETEWLDRQAAIWLTQGRKAATYAAGVANITGIAGVPLPAGTQFSTTSPDGGVFLLASTTQITIGGSATNFNWQAISAGATGLQVGSSLTMVSGISGINGQALVSSVVDGVPEETDDELRVRVLDRIREPPMGGDANDYVQWALEFPGVTRAWSAPNEMGIGTVTVRFMMDDLRASADPTTDGFPLAGDVTALQAYLDNKRPVAIKDFFVEAPIPEQINFTVQGLFPGDAATKAAITANAAAMLRSRAKPASARNGVLQPPQEIYAAWVSDAVLNAQGVEYFDLIMDDHFMPNNGAIAVLGVITYT